MSVIERVGVYYESFLLGQVSVHDDGSLGFGYDPRWLATRGGFPLSLTMPRRPGVFPNEVIAPWLANLLPEEQQLASLSRALGLDASDVLAILRRIGGDTAGAISVGEPSLRENWAYRPLRDHYGQDTEAAALERHFDDLGHRPFLAGEDGVRLSLAGGQKKAALAVLDGTGRPKPGLPAEGDRLAIPMTGAPSTVIIKPDNPALPGIVENEAYCLTLARLVGLPAAECRVLATRSRTALGVARYDRQVRRDGSLRRIHQEDLAQANGIPPGRKYEQGTLAGPGLGQILSTGNSLPPKAALGLLDQVIYNILVANTDAHAKNYSILLGTEPAMAPLYDVSSVLHWDHVNQYHAQKIGGRKRKPADTDRRHWDRIAAEAGLNARGLRLRVQELVDAMVARRMEATRIVSDQPGASAEMVEHVAGLIEQNALRIAGRLKDRGPEHRG